MVGNLSKVTQFHKIRISCKTICFNSRFVSNSIEKPAISLRCWHFEVISVVWGNLEMKFCQLLYKYAYAAKNSKQLNNK